MCSSDLPDPATTSIILLGRGSSDMHANGDMARMARWLYESEPGHELVDLAFTGVTWPRLERVAQRQARLGMGQIVVLPYYLFTGVLMQRIQRQVQHLCAQYPQIRFACTLHFGLEPEIFSLSPLYLFRPATILSIIFSIFVFIQFSFNFIPNFLSISMICHTSFQSV